MMLSKRNWIHKRYLWETEIQYERPELYSLVRLAKQKCICCCPLMLTLLKWEICYTSAFSNAGSSSYLSFPHSYQNYIFGTRFFLFTTIIMFAKSESIGNHWGFFWKAFNQAKIWDIHHKWVWFYYNKFYPATQAVILLSISHS